MGIRLDDEALQFLGIFTDETGANATDCVVTEAVVVYVVPPNQMADAIGPEGRTVRALERKLDRRVVLVEDADRPTDFVANALAPAAVYDVALEKHADETVAIADVADDDVGVAIGEGGTRIELARQLVRRHFDIDDITVQSATP